MADGDTQGLVIPTAFSPVEETLSNLYDYHIRQEHPLIAKIVDVLINTSKDQESIKNNSSEQTEKIQKIHDIQKESKPGPHTLKLRDKLTLMWDKLRKSKWFLKIGDSLKNLAEKGGGFLIDLLKFLMFGAFFPGVFKFLVTFFIKIGIMLISILAEMLPGLIDTFLSLIPWLGKALADAVPKIAAAFVKIFDVLAKKFPAIKFLFDFLKWLVSGPLVKVLQFLFHNIELVLIALSAFVLIMKVLPIISKIASAAQMAYAAAIWLVTSPIGLVILALVSLAAILISIWYFRDKIVGFFENIFKWFQNLSLGAKILVTALALLFWPITSIALSVYNLAKLFQYINKVGFSTFINQIKDFFINLWDVITTFFSGGRGDLSGIIIGYFKDLINVFWNYFEGLFIAFKKFFIAIWNADSAGELFTAIENLFHALLYNIWNLFKGIFLSVINLWGGLISLSFKTYIDFLLNTWKFIKKIFKNMIQAAGNFARDLWNNIKSMFNVKNLIMRIKSTVDTIFGPGAWGRARRNFSRFISKLVGKARSVLQGLFDLFKGMWLWARTGFGKLGGPALRESVNISTAQRLGKNANRIKAAVRSGQGERIAAELLRGSAAENQGLVAAEIRKLQRVSGSSEQRQAEIASILNRISDKLSVRGKVSLLDTDSNGGR